MIKRMKKDSFLLLVVGILLGFAVTYGLVRDRDLGPIVVREPATTRAALEAELEEELGRVRALEARLEQDPGNFQILVDLANLYFDMQSLDGAIDYYSRALEIRPHDANVRTDMGTALFYSNQPDAALSEFERSLDIQPNHPQTLFNIGIVLLEERGEVEGAIEVWERLIDLNPGYSMNAMVQQEIDKLRGSL